MIPQSLMDAVAQRLMYEQDVRILFGESVLVTGIPGPHARARMAAVAEENRLTSRIITYEEQHR